MIDDGALIEADNFGVEQESFFDVVGDGEDGDAELEGALLHAGEEGVAEVAVEAGERLVEEKEFGLGDGEGAGEIDALAFAAGEIAGHAVGERGELEEVEDLLNQMRGWVMGGVGGEADVLTDGEMREEDCALGGVGNGAPVGREILLAEIGFGFGKKAAGGAKDGALAAAGRAEDYGPWGGEVDIHAEMEDT